jgi:hypothetical protein
VHGSGQPAAGLFLAQSAAGVAAATRYARPSLRCGPAGAAAPFPAAFVRQRPAPGQPENSSMNSQSGCYANGKVGGERAGVGEAGACPRPFFVATDGAHYFTESAAAARFAELTDGAGGVVQTSPPLYRGSEGIFRVMVATTTTAAAGAEARG